MDLASIYPQRSDWIHKGQNGRLLVVAGSKIHTGSAIFNGMAALRAGCDLVFVCAPKRAADTAANFSPDLITYPQDGDFLQPKHEKIILEIIKDNRIGAMVMGGGLGQDKKTQQMVLSLVSKIKVPMVLDADALRILAKAPSFNLPMGVVLTPHADELKDLINERVSTELEIRKELVTKCVQKYKGVVLLKGFIDIVSDGQTTFLNNTGSPLMTKGGFGDTLAGICGAFLARGVLPFQAACAAAYINGKAGELAAKDKGEGLLASDIFDYIPKAVA